MAVDIKSLRIGSHVDFNGRRVKIKAIVEDIVAFDYPQDEKQLLLSPNAYDEFLSPIPITPDLLKELGLEERRREYKYGAPDVWYIDREAAQLEKENNLVVPTIHVSSLEKPGYPDWWVIKVVIADKPARVNDCTARYLHEAEAFLALCGVELITE